MSETAIKHYGDDVLNIQEITQMAQDFRKAIDDAFDWGEFGQEYPFSNFPHECCDDVCDLFGELLLRNNVQFTQVFGRYRYNYWDKKYSHVWIELNNGIIVDLTGDQYKDDPIMLNYDNPCYIGFPDRLHQLFLEEEYKHIHFAGIDNYIDENTRKRLKRLYKSIMLFYRK